MTSLKRLSQSLADADSAVESCDKWISQGWDMATKEGQAAFESIEIRHAAEVRTGESVVQGLKAMGAKALESLSTILNALDALGYNAAEHLRQIACGKLDLTWAVGLLVLNGTLAAAVLFAFGPGWMSFLLALLVLVSALPVEEFCQAHEERNALREGVFLFFSAVALFAQFWLGSVRGLFLAALTPAEAGPVSQALAAAAVILRYTLGIFSVLSEVLCGYKLAQARSRLLSATARAVRERERCEHEVLQLHAALESAKADPEIRRGYRIIGARQYLASAATADQRAQADHLKNAFKGALVALVILVVLFLLVSRLSAAPVSCRITVGVPDLSKSTSAASFEANLNGVSQVLARLNAGDRAVVVGITDGFGRPAILLDKSVPADGGYLGLQLQVAREGIAAQWRAIAKNLRPTFSRTDVVGSLTVVSYLAGLASPDTCIFVFSDLQQSTKELDLEHLTRVPVGPVIQRLKQTKAIPSLKGSKVFLLGVDPVGKSAAYFGTLQEFWMEFFKEAGAEVRIFTMDRRIPEF